MGLTPFNNPKKDSFYGYNMADGLRHFRADLGASDSQIVHVAHIGTSIVFGTNSTDTANKSIVGRLRTLLQAKYGACGEGFVDPKDSRWVFTGTWTDGGSGISAKYKRCSDANGTSKMTITLIGTRFDVVYAVNGGGGTVTVKVDTVAQGTTINTNGTLAFGNIQSYTGFTNASHTIEIFAPPSGACWIEGIIAYTDTKGIMLHKLGAPSTKTSDWLPTYQTTGTNNLAPSLVIMELGVNDCAGAVDLTTFYNNLKTIVATNITGSPSILFHLNHIGTTTPNWANYVPIYYRLADELNAAVFSVYDKWGRSWATADGLGLMGATHDVIHPGDKGYYDIAMGLAKHLAS